MIYWSSQYWRGGQCLLCLNLSSYHFTVRIVLWYLKLLDNYLKISLCSDNALARSREANSEVRCFTIEYGDIILSIFDICYRGLLSITVQLQLCCSVNVIRNRLTAYLYLSNRINESGQFLYMDHQGCTCRAIYLIV